MIKIIYHANCSDGFCSAYIFWKTFVQGDRSLFGGDTLKFIPMSCGAEIEWKDFSSEDFVFMLDFSFKREPLTQLANIVRQVWILDHHKTAEEELKDFPLNNVHITFDMEKSGAQLTWEYVHNNTDYSTLVKYVADRDLWKWELPHSELISMYVNSFPFDFEVWKVVEYALWCHYEQCVVEGEAIKRFKDKQVQLAVDNAVNVGLHMLNGEVFSVKAVNTTVNFSEVASELAKQDGVQFGICWYQCSDGKYKYSLRSRDDFDVSKIAKAFGGGGHKNAAGFESQTQVL